LRLDVHINSDLSKINKKFDFTSFVEGPRLKQTLAFVLAHRLKANIRQRIAEGGAQKENSPITIKIKGEGKPPLFDTGKLFRSIKDVGSRSKNAEFLSSKAATTLIVGVTGRSRTIYRRLLSKKGYRSIATLDGATIKKVNDEVTKSFRRWIRFYAG